MHRVAYIDVMSNKDLIINYVVNKSIGLKKKKKHSMKHSKMNGYVMIRF